MKTNSSYEAADVARWRDWARDERAVRAACHQAAASWFADHPTTGPHARPTKAGHRPEFASGRRQARYRKGRVGGRFRQVQRPDAT